MASWTCGRSPGDLPGFARPRAEANRTRARLLRQVGDRTTRTPGQRDTSLEPGEGSAERGRGQFCRCAVGEDPVKPAAGQSHLLRPGQRIWQGKTRRCLLRTERGTPTHGARLLAAVGDTRGGGGESCGLAGKKPGGSSGSRNEQAHHRKGRRGKTVCQVFAKS